MMHKIKKATATTKGVENAEFIDYRNRLDILASYLRESSAELNECERAWREVCHAQKAYSENFANRYPDKDNVRDFSKKSVALSETLVREFGLRTENLTTEHWKVNSIVTDYLAEIAEICHEYKCVGDAMKEVSMYSKKVNDLQTAKKADGTKIERNLEKLDEAKSRYETVLNDVVNRMKALYKKRQVALKATYVAYWSAQLRAIDLLDRCLRPTRDFVESSVGPMLKLNIRDMAMDEVGKLVNMPPLTESKSISGACLSSPCSAIESHIE